MINPTLAHDYKKYPLSRGYSQPKLDGIRCVANRHGLWTRTGKPILSCPHIHDALTEYFDTFPDMQFDGELYNHDFKDDFNKITSLVRKVNVTRESLAETMSLVQYHIYDIADENKDFNTRTGFIDGFFLEAPLVQVPTTLCFNQEELDACYRGYIEEGYEGQMVRDGDSLYVPRRSKSLLKRKEFITEEFEVIGMETGINHWADAIKKLVCVTADGEEFGAGMRGTMKELNQLMRSNATPHWATIRYFELTPRGIPRFPTVVDYGWEKRDD